MTAGHLYPIAGGGSSLKNGVPAKAAALYWPTSVTLDSAGNVVIADTFHSLVRVVAYTTGTFYGQPMTSGDIYTVAGNGTEGSSGDLGPATAAELAPAGVAQDHAGNLMTTDAAGALLRVVPPVSGTFYGQQMTAGHIYTVAGGGTSYPGDGGPATSGEFARPAGLVLDGKGNVLVADYYGDRVRMVAVTAGTFYGQHMTAGDLYTIAGNGTAGFSGDGGPATSAELNAPGNVSLDGSGNVVLADTVNQRIRVIAATTGTFYGQRMTAGHIYTVAGGGTSIADGGPATGAELFDPQDAVAAAGGGLLIADTSDGRVRLVSG